MKSTALLLLLLASLPVIKALEAAQIRHRQQQAFCEDVRQRAAQIDEAALAKAGWIVRFPAECSLP